MLDVDEIVIELASTDWTGREFSRRAEVVRAYEGADAEGRRQVRLAIGEEISTCLVHGDKLSLDWASTIIARAVAMISAVDLAPKTITREDL